MTLRESHQICQLDLERLTEPLQLYIPREEEIEEPPKTDQSEAAPEPDQSAAAVETQPEETDKTEEPPEQGKSQNANSSNFYSKYSQMLLLNRSTIR